MSHAAAGEHAWQLASFLILSRAGAKISVIRSVRRRATALAALCSVSSVLGTTAHTAHSRGYKRRCVMLAAACADAREACLVYCLGRDWREARRTCASQKGFLWSSQSSGYMRVRDGTLTTLAEVRSSSELDCILGRANWKERHKTANELEPSEKLRVTVLIFVDYLRVR
eukprot:6190743-Pleurochrysis_carterae.AAC.1